MKLTRSLVWIVAAALVVAAAGAWWLARSVAASPVAEAHKAPLVRTLRFSARVGAQSRVDAGSTITGRVASVHVREGDRVQAGQLLVSLDDQEARAALAQARATERQAQARVTALDSTSTAVAQAQLRQAEATLANAESELRRSQELVRQGFISASRLEDNRRAVAVAAGQRDVLQAQLGAFDRRGAERQQASAQWEGARAASEAASARLVQAQIRAPGAATVLSRMTEPGQIVQPGKPLVGLALHGPTLIVAQVDERFLDQLRVGQAAAAVPDAHPGQRLAASVLSIAPLVDAQKGAVEVKLAFQGVLPAVMREDMTVSVEVVTGERQAALVIPTLALRTDAHGSEQVFVLEEGRARPRRIRTGLRTAESVEVVQGLADGDKVLLETALRDGERVRVVQRQGPGTAAASGSPDALGAISGGMRP